MLPNVRTFRDLPDLFDEFFGSDWLSDTPAFKRGINMPSVNIMENDEQFKIEIAAPGLEKKDFKIDLDGNVLTISSEREDKKEDKGDKYVRREFGYTKFSRSFTLPETIEGEKISAKHDNGVLSVEIPKKEEAKTKPPKKIEIK
jgi:HSP20 family protein